MTTTDGEPPTLAVIAVPSGGRDWARQVQAWEEGGWETLLTPDTLWTTSPFPALAAAAAVTTRLRLRSWVLAAPLRSAPATAREVQALQDLSEGRFELGIGTGRPQAAEEAAALGLPWGTARDRRQAVEDVVLAVRERVRPIPPVVIAAAGPVMVRQAARLLTGPRDRFALAAPPGTDAASLRSLAARVRTAGPGPAPRLTFQVTGIGDLVPAWVRRSAGLGTEELRAAGAVGLLPADPDEAAELLGGWPSRYGIDEVVVPSDLVDRFTPILDRLHGRTHRAPGS